MGSNEMGAAGFEDRIPLNEAVEMYLADKSDGLAASTIRSHKSRLNKFVVWFNSKDELEYVSDISGVTVYKYKTHRSKEVESNLTLKSSLDTLKVFLKWCSNLELVPEELPERIDTRDLASEKNRKNIVQTERLENILEYLNKYEYASRRHILILVLSKTGMRVGGLRSLDIKDIDHNRRCIHLHHRPDTETPLKNKSNGERVVSVSESLLTSIQDYRNTNRIDTTDEYDRQPLITTTSGRPHSTWFAKTCYKLTQPCLYGNCPHDYNVNDCTFRKRKKDASKCPSSESTHAIRRSVLTEWLRNDIPDSAVSGRADVSTTVLENHYDSRKKLEKMEQRRKEFDF